MWNSVETNEFLDTEWTSKYCYWIKTNDASSKVRELSINDQKDILLAWWYHFLMRWDWMFRQNVTGSRSMDKETSNTSHLST